MVARVLDVCYGVLISMRLLDCWVFDVVICVVTMEFLGCSG